MAILSRKHGYLFILNPRTGCTAIADGALVPHRGGAYLPAEDVRDGDGRLLAPRKHTTIAQIRRAKLLEEEELRRLFVFVGVRNPFDSLVSLFEKIRRQYVRRFDDPTHWTQRNPKEAALMRVAVDEGFGAWIHARYPHVWRRRPVLFQAPFLERADFFLRFEHLQQDLDEVMGALGLPPVEVPRRNTTDRPRDYRPYYDRRSRRRIERLFAPTLERFGYRF